MSNTQEFNEKFALLEHAALPRDARVPVVRDALAAARYLANKLQLPVAKLLAEVRQGRYWADWNHSSFASFVEDECHFSVRKAEELIRVYRKLVVELNVAEERINHLGWSKVALCAGQMTADNVDQFLAEIETQSFGREQCKLKRAAKRKPAKRCATAAAPLAELSAKVMSAVAAASASTGTMDLAINLEFIAGAFLSPSRCLESWGRFSLN